MVVNPARVATVPLLRTLLGGAPGGAPGVAIVVDRRSGERRNGNGHGNGNGNRNGIVDEAALDRRADKRRRSSALYLV